MIKTAHLFSSRGHAVTLLVLDENRSVFFPVDPSVKLLFEDLHFGISSKGNMITRKIAFWKHIQRLHYILKKINAHVVIGTEYHFSIAAALLNRKNSFRVYGWEHHHFHELEKNRFWNFLFRKYYPRLQAVICLNPDEASLFSSIGAKVTVIPNFIAEKQKPANHSKRILTVARLSRVKGIDRLIQIAPAVLKNHPDWNWLIIGEGPMKEALQLMIKEKGLQEQMVLQAPLGPDLSSAYGQSGFYVLTSRNECFPMVLLEAMSYGLPCIAFDCETGPRHIIKDKENGRLVKDGDIGEMVNVIDEAINDPLNVAIMGDKAHSSMAAFAPEMIYEKWRLLLDAE